MKVQPTALGKFGRAHRPVVSVSLCFNRRRAFVAGMEQTLLETSSELPSGAQAIELAVPRPLTSLTEAFVLTSQNLTIPSAPRLANSASLTGLNATFSTDAEWPFSSVEKRALGLSGFPEHG